MAKTVVVKLTDDIDGGDAEETVCFSLDGKHYEIDVNGPNAEKLRAVLKPFIEKGRATNRSPRAKSARPSLSNGGKTLFSQLSSEDKQSFRAWANMPTARRISDVRVKGWMAAGKP